MARRNKLGKGFLKEVSDASPSYATLLAMLVFFFISSMLFGLASALFGWIPFIGGFIAGSVFGLLNLGVLFLAFFVVFLVEWAASGKFGKALLAFFLFLLFDILPFNFVWPIALIAVKALNKK